MVIDSFSKPAGVRGRGVTLVMVAGVLAVLAALGAGFYTLMLSQTRSASRYADSVSAELLARAGIEDAIARLRDQAFLKTEDPSDPWYTVDYLHGAASRISFPAKNTNSQTAYDKFLPYTRALENRVGDASDRYILNVTDAASRINVNACDNLGIVLDNLCRVIGPPLIAANQDFLQPARWAQEGASGYSFNKNDKPNQGSTYYMPTLKDNLFIDRTQDPVRNPDGSALYGDGFAIARYRASHGLFKSISDVRLALTVRPSPGHPELEELERSVKFDALKDYITISSWVDTTTVCTGKFEWVADDSADAIAIDRDKSWIEDDPINDPHNFRGSLRGSYVSIVNGHGAGQLRRISTNGADWIKVDKGFTVMPGPISSYMIVAREDALTQKINIPNGLGPIEIPQENADGTLVDDPNIDYSVHPLCIHRAPVNINTASDKVLIALFMGINVQHGHPMAVGTDADLTVASTAWRKSDPHQQEPYLLTFKGVKRVPASTGKLTLDRPKPWLAADDVNFGYIDNYGSLSKTDWVNGGGVCNEAHELAYRVIRLRQRKVDANGNPTTGQDLDSVLDKSPGYPMPRGPFTSWDDFYFRVVRPWDNQRIDPQYNKDFAKKIPLSPMIMANFNPNTDILKFNPNIEWIDRWGRNFTEMEPVMQYTDQAEPHSNNPPVADPIGPNSIPIYPTGEARSYSGLTYRIFDYNAGIEGTYVIRSYRYRSTDVIDKTDLNRATTEFSFDSGGIFQITSIGQTVRGSEVLSERRMDALVKVYDVWRETTQAQFVKGTISTAAGAPGTNFSGTVTRALVDHKKPNVETRLALVTDPEPLVPKNYRIKNQGLPSQEVVEPSGTMYDAWGNVKSDPTLPDIIANHVQPASYDGQIKLATNTSDFDPTGKNKDTFLASFNGDLDTGTCVGNGREQAKMPHIDKGRNAGQGYKFRVVDTCGLLGILNDDLIDMEPDYNLRKKMYMFRTIDNALSGLKKENYWNNVTLRMGDLRTEGVFLSSPGVSGNDATLKYLVGEKFENFDPGSADGFLLTMWFKSTWKHTDGRNHEFFNCTNPGKFYNARACYLQKEGRWAFAGAGDNGGISNNGKRGNDLMWAFEGTCGGHNDSDLVCWMHGGRNHVNDRGYQLSWENGGGAANNSNTVGESPMFRVQPFRWNMAGVRLQHDFGTCDPDSSTEGRFSANAGPAGRDHMVKNFTRCFMMTQLYPEGPSTWKPDSYWITCLMRGKGKFDPGSNEIGRAAQSTGMAVDTSHREIDFRYSGDVGGTSGQDVKWNWADPKTDIADKRYTQKVFSINNLNYGNSDRDMNVPDNSTGDNDQNNMWIYRHLPDGGTYAVIDELKISKTEKSLISGSWGNDRGLRELSTSRYYLPNSPKNSGECPFFDSQTMLDSIKGAQKQAAQSAQKVTLARVTWTVFTPRFMHDYILPQQEYARDEILFGKTTALPAKGPFWYETYNNLKTGSQVRYDFAQFDDKSNKFFPYRVNRIPPQAYPYGTQPHHSKGVEVELLNDTTKITSGWEGLDGVFTSVGGTFKNPDTTNTFRDPNNPNAVQSVDASKLRYRVRFRYPVDSLFVDKGETVVDPTRMILLDTPVFDDISITYLARPRILELKMATE